MKIIDLIEQNSVTFSCEIFPPKPHIPLDECKSVIKGIAKTNPDFISVTYGAGGSNSKRTIEIADHIQTQYQIPALAHLTCVASAKSDIASTLHQLKDKHITNILALRGDVPQGMNPEDAVKDYCYAYQLIEDIKSQGDFCVGAACYPEGHIECSRKMDDIDHLKRKVDCGCDFLTTQMFFDNQILYNFGQRHPCSYCCRNYARNQQQPNQAYLSAFRNIFAGTFGRYGRKIWRQSACNETSRNCLCHRTNH